MTRLLSHKSQYDRSQSLGKREAETMQSLKRRMPTRVQELQTATDIMRAQAQLLSNAPPAEVEYLGAVSAQPLARSEISVQTAADKLQVALGAIRAFSTKYRGGFWNDQFDDAALRFTLDEPESDRKCGTSTLLATTNHSLLSRQLVSAATSTYWLWGGSGMGSWWDWAEKDPDVRALDIAAVNALWEAVQAAIIAGVNHALE
jgi:hypothetical protein